MDSKKQAAFVRAAKNRQRFAKGGLIKRLGNRKYFAEGARVGTLGGPSGGGTTQNATNPNSGFLGSINGALGLNNNFQAGAADIQAGTNSDQLNNAYTDVQGALGQQQGVVNALNPQISSAVGNQNALANQLYGMTQGQGPNPAQAELAQQTNKNVAQTGAQMAGARGASGNVGLMARQIGQQGAATEQQAVGQEATLQAQQQIAAQQNLANLANNQISQAGQAVTGLNSGQQNEQAILQNANTSYNNAAVGMQSNINNTNAQTAAANQNMNANTMGGLMSGASSVMSMFGAHGGEVHHKIAEMNAQSMMHLKKFADGGEVDDPDLGKFSASDDSASSPNIATTSSLPADQTNFADAMGGGKKSGGGGGGLGGIMALAALADGGMIQSNPLLGSQSINGSSSLGRASYSPGSASGGPSVASTSALPSNTESFSKDVKDATSKKKTEKEKPEEKNTQPGPTDNSAGMKSQVISPDMMAQGGRAYPGPHQSHVANFLAAGGPVPAMLSENEVYLSPDKVHKVLHEGANPLKIGEKIKAKDASQRARVKGDSYSNDKIPKDLEEGGVVIDREHVMNPDKAALFVHRAVARKKAGGK